MVGRQEKANLDIFVMSIESAMHFFSDTQTLLDYMKITSSEVCRNWNNSNSLGCKAGARYMRIITVFGFDA